MKYLKSQLYLYIYYDLGIKPRDGIEINLAISIYEPNS